MTKPFKVCQVSFVTTIIRTGPDRAYPLHFTRPQLLLLPVLLPVLLLPVLPLLCVRETGFGVQRCLELNVSVITLHFRNEIGMESVSFSFLCPIL